MGPHTDTDAYVMQTLYYAQSTDAQWDHVSRRYLGAPHTLVKAQVPIPRQVRTMNMQRAHDLGTARATDEVYCSFVTDVHKIVHPGEINKVRTLRAQDNDETAKEMTLTHIDHPSVLLWDWTRQPRRMVKVTSKTFVPDYVLSHPPTNNIIETAPYFALDSRVSMVASGGPDQIIAIWNIADECTRLANPATVPSTLPSAMPLNVQCAPRIYARHLYHGHTATIEDLTFHHTHDSLLASVSDDRMCILWDTRVPNGLAARIATGHSDDVNAVSWNSVDDQFILTASSDSSIHLLDLRLLTHVQTHNQPNNNSSSPLPSASSSSSSSSNGASKTYNCTIHNFANHSLEVKNVEWAPDGIHFASGGDDANVCVWTTLHASVERTVTDEPFNIIQTLTQINANASALPLSNSPTSHSPNHTNTQTRGRRSTVNNTTGHATLSTSDHYASALAALDQQPPTLLFTHATHRTAIQCIRWNPLRGDPHHGYIIASINHLNGGIMDIWRMNDLIWRDFQTVSLEVKEWRKKRRIDAKQKKMNVINNPTNMTDSSTETKPSTTISHMKTTNDETKNKYESIVVG